VREAAARTQAVNNLKQIALAFHNYHDTHKRLPTAAISDLEGKPLLSWRVALLPYLEQEGLYREFRLDESWDSGHNLKLLERMPNVYHTPHRADIPVGANSTFFQVVVGPGTAFELGLIAKMPDSFPDGTANTILVVEAGSAVPWTKPEDIRFDPDGPLPPLGGLFRGDAPFRLFGSNRWKGMHIALADGQVRAIQLESIGETNLRRAIVRNEGKGLDPD
jgi:uncharacterized protein DUF1559